MGMYRLDAMELLPILIIFVMKFLSTYSMILCMREKRVSEIFVQIIVMLR